MNLHVIEYFSIGGKMLIYKTYKFRIYPNDIQKEKITLFFKARRFIYNKYLYDLKNIQSKGKTNTLYSFKNFQNDFIKLKQDNPWLNDIDGCIMRTTLQDINNAYNKFLKGESNFPKYKGYYQTQTYKTVCIRHNYKKNSTQSVVLDLSKKIIKLPKLGEVIIRGYRNVDKFTKNILSVTVKKIGKKYYAYVLASDNKNDKQVELEKIVGIDLGVKNMVVTSDGVKYPKLDTNRLEYQISLLQKKLSQAQKRSKNREKIALKIQKKYQQIVNKRLTQIHSITNEFVRKYDIIVVEDLSVREMLQKNNSSLSNKIQNAAFHEIIKQLENKTYQAGKKLVKVDRFFPSSQLCSKCGYKNKKLKNLDIRSWVCPNCGITNDRDINASINIMKEGYRKYLISNSKITINELR